MTPNNATSEQSGRPARVLYIHHGGGIGGAPISLLTMIKALDRERFEPVLMLVHKSDAVDLFRNNGLEVHLGPGYGNVYHTVGRWNSVRQFPRLAMDLRHAYQIAHGTAEQYFQKFKPDLVHLNSATLIAWAIAAKRSSIPVVCHVREPLHPGYIGLRKQIMRRLLAQNTDAIVCISEHDRELIGGPPQAQVVYNFVDFAEFDRNRDCTTLRADLKIAPAAPVILFVGGINPLKGALQVAQCAAVVRKQHPDAVWLIAGRGATKAAPLSPWYTTYGRYEREYWGYVKAQELDGTLRHIGVRADMAAVMNMAEVVVFPSTKPHFARPLMEAAALAKVGIGSDFGGPREIIENGVTGFLVPPGDVGAMAGSVMKVIQDPECRVRLGEAAYARARLQYDAKRNVGRIMDIYDAVLAQARNSISHSALG